MRKLTLITILIALFALVLAGGAPAGAQTSGTFDLTILHSSENHGHWEPMVFSEVSQGGIARRSTLVKQVRKQVPNTLLLDSGDVSQGTLYYVQYKGAEGRDLYNMLGYDVVTFGNHEFDLGTKNMVDNFLTGAKYSVVNANVDMSGEPLLAGKIPPYVIKTVGGQKIGIFGMVIDYLPISTNIGPNIKMKDAVQSAKDAVSELTKQGVNKIIMLSHRGLSEDIAIASKVDGIDIIVSGHTNELLGDPAKLDKSLGVPYSIYPLPYASPNGGRTLIVHAFEWGRVLGRLDVTFDDKGSIVNWGGGPIFVDKSIADDTEVAAKLTELGKPLQDLRKQIIGKTSVDLDGERATVRNKESNLGNLIADAMLAATRGDKTQIAITNGGGIRASIKAGDVSYGQILEVLPFGNRIVQFDLTGADVRASLENGVSALDANPANSAGRFPQVSGLKFSADLSKPTGSRVTDVQIGDAKAGFKPLDPAATYRIATNDFMAAGGDGYSAFKRGKNSRGGDIPLDQALSDYIKANPNLAPKVEGRITLTGALQPSAQATVTATTAATGTVTATVAVTVTRTITAAAPATATVTATRAVTTVVATPAATPATLPPTGGTQDGMIAFALVGLLMIGGAVIMLRIQRTES